MKKKASWVAGGGLCSAFFCGWFLSQSGLCERSGRALRALRGLRVWELRRCHRSSRHWMRCILSGGRLGRDLYTQCQLSGSESRCQRWALRVWRRSRWSVHGSPWPQWIPSCHRVCGRVGCYRGVLVPQAQMTSWGRSMSMRHRCWGLSWAWFWVLIPSWRESSWPWGSWRRWPGCSSSGGQSCRERSRGPWGVALVLLRGGIWLSLAQTGPELPWVRRRGWRRSWRWARKRWNRSWCRNLLSI